MIRGVGLRSCNILGVNVAVTNMAETMEYIEDNIEKLKGDYICVSNVHTKVMAYDNEEYIEVQNSGVLVLPDGGPLSVVQRRRGYKSAKRVTGPDLMGEIFNISEENGYKHYFYGSTEKTLKELRHKLLKEYPNLNIVGMYSPPFRSMVELESQEVLNEINKVNAYFLWIGLGAPKQEKWINCHKYKVNSLMIGVGAGFDYYAGNIKRAPKWMQKCNLEWLYRLMQDPKRLFVRYLNTNVKFILLNSIKKKQYIDERNIGI